MGTTSSSSNTAGIKLTSAGTATFVRSGVQPVYVNRLTSDGDLAVFAKDGSTVGSIGTISAGLSIGSGDTGLYFESISNEIRPFNTTTNGSIDNAINLGNSTKRFKDLYLSGGVYLGGTGSANKLDDYEEGTVTDALKMGGAAPTGASYTASYTKVGNVITYSIYAGDPTVVFGTDGNLTIDLPFAAKSNSSLYQAASLYLGSSSGVAYPTNYWWSISSGASVATLHDSSSFNDVASLTASNCTQLYIRVAFTYLTA